MSVAIKDPPNEALGDFQAYDSRGALYYYVESEYCIYEDGDAEPFMRVKVRDADELRIAVESYRKGQCVGERIGRELQQADIRRVLGLTPFPSSEAVTRGQP